MYNKHSKCRGKTGYYPIMPRSICPKSRVSEKPEAILTYNFAVTKIASKSMFYT